ncbi:unnamed protein product [Porites evermanni]|uniref:SH2 domain-containing protein n=1 Tax=Porites evermanni TaxID=104178 RepID=A0ABN8S0Y3_9CNID|nr:unnamed protein product [Porites evermanni]
MSSLTEASIHDWDVDKMIFWLTKEGLRDCIGPFSSKKINGLTFLNLSEFDIKTFQISQESKRFILLYKVIQSFSLFFLYFNRKLTKVLKRIKGKKRHGHRSFEDEPREMREQKRPSAIPTHIDHHDEGDEGWGSDFDSEDDEYHEDVDSDSGSGGEYIEPEGDDVFSHHGDESNNKVVPNVPLGLVAQLRAGLNGSIARKPYNSPAHGQSPVQTPPVDEEIYDIPPEEEEVYEEPSDDSGSGIVVRPMSKAKLIRCPSEASGEYIDARVSLQYSKNPRRGERLPPFFLPITPCSHRVRYAKTTGTSQEIYDEVPEDDQPGCSQVIEEYEPYPQNEQPGNSHVVEEYEPFEPPIDSRHLFIQSEVKPKPIVTRSHAFSRALRQPHVITSTLPARLPPREKGWKPLRKSSVTEKAAKPLPKEPVKPAKPMPAPNKPHISPKPGPQKAASVKKTPEQQPRASRLYPGPNSTGPIKSPAARGLSSHVLSPPSPKPVNSQRTPPTAPAKNEENNNITNNNTPPSRISMLERPTSAAEDSPPPPPPPRPGSKTAANKVCLMVVMLQSTTYHAHEPTSPPKGLRPLPSQPKSPVDQLKTSPWFHGPLDKKIAEDALKSFSKDGAFIVRNSSRDANNYSMSLYLRGSVRHLRIPRTKEKFVLGDSGKVQFDTIMELVDYYSQHQVDLKTGGSTTLTAACPRK